MSRTIGTWATATVVAGTLDLLSAFLFSAIAGFGPVMAFSCPAMPLPHGLLPIGEQLFSHLILIGIPIAMITARRALGIGVRRAISRGSGVNGFKGRRAKQYGSRRILS